MGFVRATLSLNGAKARLVNKCAFYTRGLSQVDTPPSMKSRPVHGVRRSRKGGEMPSLSETIDKLPPRLQPVASLLSLGWSNKEIADSCGLAVHSVENYVSETLAQCDMPNRARFVAAVARESGIREP